MSTDGRDCLAMVRSQSEHLFRMLSDLLTLAGLNTGTLGVDVSPVRLSTILSRLQPLADQLRTGKDIEVVWDCPAALPSIETDPLLLEQILGNLLSNAFKFTAHGRVSVRVLAQTDEGRVAIEVTDTGIDIPVHELPHIFDEFRQVDGSLTRRYGGVGLGLTLSRKLTALLCGSLTVRSEAGAGSTFTVVLPVQFHATAAASVAA